MILFLLAGFGYGNASRQLAIIEELRRRRPDTAVAVFSWGRGYEFLRSEAESLNIELHSLRSGKLRRGHSYGLSMLLSALFYVFFYPVNICILICWAWRRRPKVVVFDSDYHIPAFIFFRGRRICINQAPMVCAVSRRFPLSFIIKKGFLFSYVIEKLDGWFLQLFADKILVPQFPGSAVVSSKKTIPIPLIVRRGFLRRMPAQVPNLVNSAVILGGSGADSAGLRLWAQERGLTVFEKRKGAGASSAAFVHALQEYSLVIIQGGLSSISELLALGKYILVLPVRQHWEQFINSSEVMRLQLGRRTTLQTLDEARAEFFKNPQHQVLEISDCHGAVVACDHLLKELDHEK